MSFQMPPRPKFSTEDFVKIVEWWCELKDIHKVRWRYAKEKGIEHFPRKLPTMKNFISVKPKTLNDLKEVVESLDEEEVRRAVRDVRPRAELCIKMDGSHFESQLKKYKRGTIEELKYPVRLPLGTRECLCYV